MIAAADLVAMCGQAEACALADVICCGGPFGVQPALLIRRTLHHWPGAVVATVRTGEHECVAGTRDQTPVKFKLRALGGGDVCPALLCGCLLYWRLTGWPEPGPWPSLVPRAAS